MGIVLKRYSVQLEYFYQSLGSKNQETIDQALSYLEQNRFSYFDKRKEASLRLLVYKLLYLMVFEGVIGVETLTYDELLELSKDEEINIQTGLINSIVAILAQGQSFKDYAGFNVWRYTQIYEELLAKSQLTEQSQMLWEYLLNGRALKGEIVFNQQYYSYILNNELNILLESLYQLKNEAEYQAVGITLGNDLESTVSNFEEIIKEILEAGNDLFVHLA